MCRPRVLRDCDSWWVVAHGHRTCGYWVPMVSIQGFLGTRPMCIVGRKWPVGGEVGVGFSVEVLGSSGVATLNQEDNMAGRWGRPKSC